MLGLRRYKKLQIDIWQGDISEFFVDASVRFDFSDHKSVRFFPGDDKERTNHICAFIPNQLESPSVANKTMENIYRQIFECAESSQLRHISIPGHPFAAAEIENNKLSIRAAMFALRNYLDVRNLPKLARVTFVARDGTMYDSLQKHLFAEFPDELDDQGF